jgi:hypothetical protein
MAPKARLGYCQPHPGGWHSSWSRAGDAVFLSGQLVEGLKGKCALGPFLSILVIECQHKCLNVKICP